MVTYLIRRTCQILAFLLSLSIILPAMLKGELLSHEAAVYYRTKGYQYQLQDDIEKAIEFYLKAIEFDNNYAAPHNDLGILYEEKGDYKKAERAYQKALEIDPDYLNACTNLALLYEMQGRIQEAIPYWRQRADQGDPDDAWTLRAKDKLAMFAPLEEKIGGEAGGEGLVIPEVEKEEAYRIAGEIIEERLKFMDSDVDLARRHFSQGVASYAVKDYQEALNEFRLAAALEPDDEMIKKYIALCGERLKDFDEEALNRERSRGLAREAMEKMKKGDYRAAKDRLEVARELDPANEKIVELLAANREAEIEYQIRRVSEERLITEKKKLKEVEEAWLGPSKAVSGPGRPAPGGIGAMSTVPETTKEAARQNLEEKIKNTYVPAISLRDADVRDLIRQLMDMTEVTIVLDEAALARATEEEPIKLTFSTVNPLPLSDLLDIALRTTDLSYKVETNYIWISDRERVRQEDLETKTYRLKYGVRKFRKVELKEFQEGGSPNY